MHHPMPEIHKAARDGKARLQAYLVSIDGEERATEKICQTYENRTVLHYAANIENKKEATAMIKIILSCALMRQFPQCCWELVNLKVEDTEDTALHMAARNYNQEGIAFLLKNGADLTLKNRQGVEPIQLLYENVPRAILPEFDKGITLRKNVTEVSSTDEDLELHINFGVFAGVPDSKDANRPRNETNLIQPALNLDSEHKASILSHPIVELFLHYKWNRIKYFIWCSILFHVTWSVCCTTYFVGLYRFNCPYIVANKSEDDEGVPCRPTNLTFGLEIAIVLMWLILVAKEIYEFCQIGAKRYFAQMENWGQLHLIACVATLLLPKIISGSYYTKLSKWEYPLAAVSTTLAFVLVLAQVGKLPVIGIYMKMLGTVSRNCFYFMIVYGVLLISFWSGFVILLPERDEFQSYGFVKMTMFLVGEVNFDDVFFGGKESESSSVEHNKVPFFVWTQILFLVATLIVTIVMANLLIGILVNDIAALKNLSHLSTIETQLREINLMEIFWLSGPLRKIVPRGWYNEYIVVLASDDEQEPKSATTISTTDTIRSSSSKKIKETYYHLCLLPQEENIRERRDPYVISLNDKNIPKDIRKLLRAKVKDLYF